jgi:cation diffusion facilitator family transporter
VAESGTGESRTAVLAALLGNAALAALKGVAAAFTGSAAMLAETFHSLADTGNEALLFLGMRLAARPPDERHPFGHGKDVYFWAFVVSVMLFTLGAGFSIWEAVRHYLHPVSRTESAWAYGVLAGGFVFESASLLFAVRGIRAAMGDQSFGEYWRDARDPTLPTVLLGTRRRSCPCRRRPPGCGSPRARATASGTLRRRESSASCCSGSRSCWRSRTTRC